MHQCVLPVTEAKKAVHRGATQGSIESARFTKRAQYISSLDGIQAKPIEEPTRRL